MKRLDYFLQGAAFVFVRGFGTSGLPSTLLFFRGGSCTKVHSCERESHRTQDFPPADIKQRILRLRQLSQGLSRAAPPLPRGLAPSGDVAMKCFPAPASEKFQGFMESQSSPFLFQLESARVWDKALGVL